MGSGTSGPGCVVIVGVGSAGPDPARQRDRVDAVFERLEPEPEPAPGGVPAHFHVGTAGNRVLNYAGWESAQAHIDALAGDGEGVGTVTTRWERIQRFPGVTGSGAHRRTPALGLAAGLWENPGGTGRNTFTLGPRPGPVHTGPDRRTPPAHAPRRTP